jgi:uncharacterized membrane protein YbhN (UPF0104 family)
MVAECDLVAVHGRWGWLILFWSALGVFATIVIALAATAFGGRDDWGIIQPINARPMPWLAAAAVLAGLSAVARTPAFRSSASI